MFLNFTWDVSLEGKNKTPESLCNQSVQINKTNRKKNKKKKIQVKILFLVIQRRAPITRENDSLNIPCV